ncbi:MAG: tetratricopeptide repeat protein, partial [Candidatus Omnitrophica bacterium]|nr:tetratricopeptide repeat protein [Candidatus Omnitrophota bacterium]
MKKKSLIVIGLIVLGWALLLNTYSDKHLAAEKLFWQAEQKAIKLTKNKTYQDLSKEDLAKIISTYRKVADKFPLEPLAAKAQFVIADIYALGGEYDKAQQELKKIIANFSSQGQIASAAQFAIGKVFELKGDSQKALIEYEKVSELYPLSALGLSTPLYITQYYKTINDVVGQEKAHRQAIRHYKTLIG